MNLEEKLCAENKKRVEKWALYLVNDVKAFEKAVDDFGIRDQIKDTIEEYRNVGREIGAQSKPLVKDSLLYKTLTNGLEKPDT